MKTNFRNVLISQPQPSTGLLGTLFVAEQMIKHLMKPEDRLILIELLRALGALCRFYRIPIPNGTGLKGKFSKRDLVDILNPRSGYIEIIPRSIRITIGLIKIIEKEL